MAETDTMRPKVVEALKRFDAIPVENRVWPGTPDVNFADGWVELKWLREWPKRAGTIVEIEHFTPQQRIFHLRRSRARGNTWVLIKVARDWLLFDGLVAHELVGRATRAQLEGAATAIWRGGLNEEELRKCVSRKTNVC